jgi:hypothetical protein
LKLRRDDYFEPATPLIGAGKTTVQLCQPIVSTDYYNIYIFSNLEL